MMHFIVKWLNRSLNKENINELLNTLKKVLELSPDDLEIQIDYAQCLVQLGIAKKAETFIL